jgi:hypothetical protein
MNNSASISETPVAIENPYVGPAAFTRERHRLFKGREHETYDLGALLAARRLVLFYAQSGAGKTSLINAGLIPLLEKKRGFEVLPVARPSGTAPHGITPTNIFVYNLMVHIDKSGRATQCCADLHLTDFLLDLGQQDGHYVYLGDDEEILSAEPNELPGTQPGGIRRRALIIDQFEELFTAHPGEYEARAEFFAQLTEAMEDDPYLYVLISMRADYVHHLTRYVHLLPDGLRSRYYMPRLRYDAALRAVREPAQEKQRDFVPGVAEELIAHLRRERSQDPTGGDEQWTYGETVEPVQLQVVCYQLWQSLANSVDTITRDDLIHLAHNVLAQEEADADPLATFVDSALGTYYEQSLAEALRTTETDTTEEYLRYWFSHKLITEAGTRGFLLRGDTETAGLPEEVVKALEKRRLLRSETRAGGRWVELIHDSFIDPLRETNEAWTQQRMRQTPWVADAYRWEKALEENGEDQAEHLLLRDDFLSVALQEAGDLSRQPAVVRDFLLKSERAEANRKRIEADRRQAEARQRAEEAEARNKQLSRQRLGLTFFGVVAAIATVVAISLAMTVSRKNEALTDFTSELQAQTYDLKKSESKLLVQKTVLEKSEGKLRTQKAELEESQSKLRETTLEREAQEYLDRGKPIGAMLLSLAAANYGAEIPPQGTLLRALESTYINQEIEGPFRHRATLPFTTTRLFAGMEPGTILISSPDQIWTWHPMSGTTTAMTSTKGNLLAVSSDGSRVATRLEGQEKSSIAEYEYPEGQLETVITVTSSSRIVTSAFDQTSSILAVALCDTDPEEDQEQSQCEMHVSPLDGRETFSADVRDEIVDIAFFDSSTLIWANKKGDLFRWRWKEAPEPEPLSTPQEHKTQALLSGPDERSFYTAGCVEDEYGCDQGFFQRWILDNKGEHVPEGTLNTTTSIIALARVQDTSRIAALYNGGTSVVTWESDTAEWPALACDAAGRNLTYDEWHETMEPFEIKRSNSKVCEDYGVNGLDISFAIQAVEACNIEEARARAGEASPEDEETFLTATALQVTLKHLIDGTNTGDVSADCMLQQAVDLMDDEEIGMDDVEDVLVTVSEWSRHPVTQVNEIEAVDQSIRDWPKVAQDMLMNRVINHYLALCRSIPTDERACTQLKSTLARTDLTSLNPGQPVAGRTSEGGEWWQFQGQDGEFVTVAMDGIDEGVDAYLELLDSDGLLLAEDDDGGDGWNSRLMHPLPESGRYFVRTTSIGAPGRFDLTLTRQDPPALSLGETVTASTNEETLWQFEGEAGAFISLAMDGIDEGFDAYLKLMDANYTLLAEDDNGGDSWNSRLMHPLPESGRYFIRATNLGAPGRFNLTLTRQEPSALHFGQTVTASTDAEVLWQFEGEAGTFISLAMDGIDEGFDAYLELLDANSSTLVTDDDGGDGRNSQLTHLLPTSGRYFVRATSIVAPGSYELILTRQEPSTLRFGQRVTASTDEEVLWQFESETGTFISLAMDGIDEGVDAYLELLDGNGTLLEEDDDGGDGWNSQLMYAVPASGRYIVRATTTSIGAPGRYELTLTQQEPSALRFEQTVTSSTNEEVLWQFEGEAGTFISLAMDGIDEGFDAYLELLDTSYTLLAEDDDGGEGWNSRLAHLLPASDRYFVRSTSIGIEGRYNLTLTGIEPATLSDDGVITATTNTQTLWEFEGQTGEFISLSMNGIDENFDAYLELLDTNGTTLAVDDDGGGNLNSHLSYSLPASGQYFVRATSIGTQGEYELTLTRNEPVNTDN